MHTTISSLQRELEQARERLKGVEENIKKNIGRDINVSQGPIRSGFKRGPRHLDDDGDNQKERKVFAQNSEAKGRSRNAPPGLAENRSREHDFRMRAGAQRPQRLSINSFPNNRGFGDEKSNEERVSVKKRLGDQAITVFSRLSGPPKDEEFEDEANVKISSQVIVQDAPTRKEVLAAQSRDNTSKERNKRMFGALLGTLQKFRQEENKLKEKEDKRAQVERKLEEAAAREREEAKKARQELFTSRRQQQLEIKQLEYKLLRLKQLSEWESTKIHLLNFIQTKTSPKIFFLPKVQNSKTQQMLLGSKIAINRMIEDKRCEVEKAIENHMPEIGKRLGIVKKEDEDEDDETKEEIVVKIKEEGEKESEKGETREDKENMDAPE